jgi:phytol kinase
LSVASSSLILAVSVVALMAAIAAVRRVGTRWSWDAEVSRKAVHVSIGVYALALPFLFDARWPVVALILTSLALMAWMRRPASRAGGLGATIHGVKRSSFGDVWLALAIGFVFIRSDGVYILYGLPIAVIALSDAAAALTGTTYGRMRFAVQGGVKSWEGVTAFFAVTLIISMMMLLLLTDVPRLNVIVLSLAIAAFAATVEAVSWRGLDNLFVPIGTHLFLSSWLTAPPLQLAALAAVFLVSVLIVAYAASRLGMGAHASRAFVIALFVFLGTAGIYGTVLPAAVMAVHLLAQRRDPCRGTHCDLDVIGTLAATGAIWFFVGETVKPSAINLYNLTMAGTLLGYLWIALPSAGCRMVATVAFPFAFLAFLSVGPGQGRWVEGMPMLATGSLALVATACAFSPEWFRKWRGPRIAALASIVPMTAYLLQAGIR